MKAENENNYVLELTKRISSHTYDMIEYIELDQAQLKQVKELILKLKGDAKK